MATEISGCSSSCSVVLLASSSFCKFWWDTHPIRSMQTTKTKLHTATLHLETKIWSSKPTSLSSLELVNITSSSNMTLDSVAWSWHQSVCSLHKNWWVSVKHDKKENVTVMQWTWKFELSDTSHFETHFSGTKFENLQKNKLTSVLLLHKTFSVVLSKHIQTINAWGKIDKWEILLQWVELQAKILAEIEWTHWLMFVVYMLAECLLFEICSNFPEAQLSILCQQVVTINLQKKWFSYWVQWDQQGNFSFSLFTVSGNDIAW